MHAAACGHGGHGGTPDRIGTQSEEGHQSSVDRHGASKIEKDAID